MLRIRACLGGNSGRGGAFAQAFFDCQKVLSGSDWRDEGSAIEAVVGLFAIYARPVVAVLRDSGGAMIEGAPDPHIVAHQRTVYGVLREAPDLSRGWMEILLVLHQGEDCVLVIVNPGYRIGERAFEPSDNAIDKSERVFGGILQ